ncbi:MAG: NAD(P)/FAD-dependent oxidoreductase [Candidatus Omnitrophica bacterium]|nr:NAD(P)/FAD-dependent oxidoreductase [Candidatus Omnitrophota bacterium]
MSSHFIDDVAIVGAGASGLMAGIHCSRSSLRTLILEGSGKIGAKILMSGGTRCNVTNRNVTERDYGSDSPQKVRHILAAFPVQKTVSFFQEIGVKLVPEQGGEYFPETNSARTVLDALLRELQKSGATLLAGRKVTKLFHDGEVFKIQTVREMFEAKTCVLATGGLSYPETGSDGSGYALAQSFGHSIVPTTPALTPLTTVHKLWQGLSGISLPVRLVLWSGGRRRITFEGPLLFTHFGFSGPAVLNMSRFWLRFRECLPTEIRVAFLPDLSEEKFQTLLDQDRSRTPWKNLKSLLGGKFPDRFVDALLKEIGIPTGRQLGELRKNETARLVKALFAYPLPISGTLGYEKAEVTAGGVSLEEVHTATLESKKQTGLFFAGEILDADGRIGGFNFQWAWSSAVVAAQGVMKQAHVHRGGVQRA